MNEEGAAFGAALQALWSYANFVGERTTIQEITDRYVIVDSRTLTSPKPTNVEIYQELQEIQNRVSKNLRSSFGAHRAYLGKHTL